MEIDVYSQSLAVTRDTVMNMKRDMLHLEIELREKMLDAGKETQTKEEKRD